MPDAESDARCPHCGSVGYHGVIVESGEPARSACDECGYVEIESAGHLYPGPLREVLNEVLGMLRVETTVDDIEVLADSLEKSEWLRDRIEKAFLSGCEDAFAFDRNLLRQMREGRGGTRVTSPGSGRD